MKTKEELVRLLTADVVHSISPEEEFLVESFDPKAQIDGQAAKGPRGLGADLALGLLLPYVYRFFEKAIDRFFEKAIDRFATKAADSTFDALARWIRGSMSDSDPTFVQVVQRELQQAGLDESRAVAAAPAVLKALAQHREALSVSK